MSGSLLQYCARKSHKQVAVSDLLETSRISDFGQAQGTQIGPETRRSRPMVSNSATAVARGPQVDSVHEPPHESKKSSSIALKGS